MSNDPVPSDIGSANAKISGTKNFNNSWNITVSKGTGQNDIEKNEVSVK